MNSVSGRTGLETRARPPQLQFVVKAFLRDDGFPIIRFALWRICARTGVTRPVGPAAYVSPDEMRDLLNDLRHSVDEARALAREAGR